MRFAAAATLLVALATLSTPCLAGNAPPTTPSIDLPAGPLMPAPSKLEIPAAQTLRALCGDVLAALNCKEPSAFTLRRSAGRAHEFQALYGARPASFYCDTETPGMLMLSAEPWGAHRVAVKYDAHEGDGCIRARVGVDACPERAAVRRCPE